MRKKQSRKILRFLIYEFDQKDPKLKHEIFGFKIRIFEQDNENKIN